jgi:hypothetical protein
VIERLSGESYCSFGRKVVSNGAETRKGKNSKQPWVLMRVVEHGCRDKHVIKRMV